MILIKIKAIVATLKMVQNTAYDRITQESFLSSKMLKAFAIISPRFSLQILVRALDSYVSFVSSTIILRAMNVPMYTMIAL